MRHILVNKQKKECHRQLTFTIIWMIIGIIGGNILQQKQYVSLFFIGSSVVMVFLYIALQYEKVTVYLMLGGLIVGGFRFFMHPLQYETNFFACNKSYLIEGQVITGSSTDFCEWVVLDDVKIGYLGQQTHIKSSVQLKLKRGTHMTEGDQVVVKGDLMPQQLQMNPSDFDTPLYLKGQGIVATFNVKEILQIKSQNAICENLKQKLSTKIDRLYSAPYSGIMKACLFGKDEEMTPKTRELFNASGIGHVLCISGFHVGVIMGVIVWLVGWFGCSYQLRQVLVILGIWAYALLTGFNISTVRAVTMATLLLGGRALWQEEDGYTDLAIAAGCILWHNPYQFFQAGFQLSFTAVLSIYFCMEQFSMKSLQGEWQYSKWQQTMILWLVIQLTTWPIVAYHFYEIPFWISLLNLVIIPLFSLIIIGGWLSIFSLPFLFLAQLLARNISLVLEGIIRSVTFLLKLPFATVCIGRPSIVAYVLYGLFVSWLLYRIFVGQVPKRYTSLLLGGWCVLLMSDYLLPHPLKMTALYVGQGDGVVVETPHHQMIMIDGGDEGKGKVMERYIKYCGKKQLAAAFLSHSDADHISGLIEIIEDGIEVKNLFISANDASQRLDDLLTLCDKKQIPYLRLQKGDVVTIDGVTWTCLGNTIEESDSANDHSLVALMRYGKFSALFTGDMSYDVMPELSKRMVPITLLKVSHHGSRTGTDEALLLKLRPTYAMISCGQKNRYGHPHEEVLGLLEAASVEIARTDEMGAIMYETDGNYLIENTFREEVSSCP